MSYSSYNDYNLPEELFPVEASPPWNNKGDNGLAINSNNFGGPTNSSWACNPLWDCGEKEMGCELCFHGPLRLRCGPNLLGPMGPSYVLWCQAVLNNRQAQCSTHTKVSTGPINKWQISNG